MSKYILSSSAILCLHLLFVKLMQVQIDTHFFFLESLNCNIANVHIPASPKSGTSGKWSDLRKLLLPCAVSQCMCCYCTLNTHLLGKQLKVYSINRSVVYDCFQVAEDEYHVAVFGLLNTGLERVPVVKTFIWWKNFSTTPSG